jgi:hypothetical protein
MSEEAASPTPFALRVWRAALLHADTYEEVEADKSSLSQALVVVAVACVAAGGGVSLHGRGDGAPSPDGIALPFHVAIVMIEPIVSWLVSSAFAYMVGATFFKGPETETDYAEVLRTTGFAFGPGVLFLFGGVGPELVGLIAMGLGRAWVLVASIVAVRQALDFTTLRAIGTYGVSTLLMWLVVWGFAVMPVPL